MGIRQRFAYKGLNTGIALTAAAGVVGSRVAAGIWRKRFGALPRGTS